MSVVDIHVIGAGGGSIAWEEAGAMRVGPQSAGSNPGPVCYGNGGTDPTVSDANLVLGRLDGANFAGGTLTLDREAAAAELARMGETFGMNAEAMAQGVIDIVNAKMADAIRTITVQRGIDPRDFVLVAFGGAGPAQAVALAEELQIAEVIVPVHPGAFSAWGMLQTNVRHDYKETLYSFWDLMELPTLEAAFDGLAEEGRAYLLAEGIAAEQVEKRGDDYLKAIERRYRDQAGGSSEGVTFREQYAAVLATIAVTDKQMQELAQARAVAVKDYLVNAQGLPADRAVIEIPGSSDEAEGFSGVELDLAN